MCTLLNPPTLACCQWLGLCICHERQTWGRVHWAFSLSNSSSAQTSLSMLFVSLQGLAFTLSQLSWVLITDRGHSNEVPAWLDSICSSFSTLEGRAISLKNTSLQKQTYPTPLSPTIEPCEETNRYLRPDRAYVGTVDNDVNTQGELSLDWWESEEGGCVCLKCTFWKLKC